MRSAACLPCRERKLRCDSILGIPCSRCFEDSRIGECIVPPRAKRRISRPFNGTNRRNRRQPTDPLRSTSLDQPELSEVPDLDDAAVSVRGNVSGTRDCDDDVLQKTCELITIPRQDTLAAPNAKDDFSNIQYQNRMSFVSILGEVISSHNHVNRVVNVNHPLSSDGSESSRTRLELETFGLDSQDTVYLFGRKAFTLPPQDICDEFLIAYFTYAHPYAPIFDRCELLARYRQQHHSSFVMQALLSYAVSFVDENLICRAGYKTHQEARETFYSRAVLIHNFDCEKSQLDLLQGCLLLGLSYISHHSNKDHHYWFTNALRIATNMGMHEKDAQQELEPRFRKLFRRIWCVILIRDVSFSTLGQANSLQVSLNYNMPELTDNDWSEDLSLISPDLQDMLPCLDPIHPQFLIQMFKLAKISKDAYGIVLSQNPSEINRDQTQEVLQSLLAWRCALPTLLWPESIICWSTQGLWALILLIWYARIECQIRRNLWKGEIFAGQDDSTARSHFTSAILEFDMAIRRAMLHNLCDYMPLANSFAVAMNIAFSIEVLSSFNLPAAEKLVCEEATLNGISYLTRVRGRWPRVQAMLQLFFWVLDMKGFHFKSQLECMQFEAPISMNSSAFRHSESLSSDMTDANLLDMLSGFEASMDVEDWINLPF